MAAEDEKRMKHDLLQEVQIDEKFKGIVMSS